MFPYESSKTKNSWGDIVVENLTYKEFFDILYFKSDLVLLESLIHS